MKKRWPFLIFCLALTLIGVLGVLPVCWKLYVALQRFWFWCGVDQSFAFWASGIVAVLIFLAAELIVWSVFAACAEEMFD